MKTKEIMREVCGKHTGYMPIDISKSTFTVKDLSIFRKLKRIPEKITAYFNRAKIKAVYKSDHMKDQRENYYLIHAADDTIFHITY